ncbi:MAG: NUDIX domain-containing protein [Actinomycetaceae bacterium]|nr:NUDIX domain-containing protein [Actinomycetaceae bacterium]
MATPDFILELRKHIGHAPLWIPGVTAIVVRPAPGAPPLILPPEKDLDPALVEILVVQRSDNAQWTPVTGIVDPGEEPAIAAQREILEEAGVHARPIRLLSVETVGPITYANGDIAEYLDLTFLFEWGSGEPWPADGENTQTAFIRGDKLPHMNPRFTSAVARALAARPEADFIAE